MIKQEKEINLVIWQIQKVNNNNNKFILFNNKEINLYQKFKQLNKLIQMKNQKN